MGILWIYYKHPNSDLNSWMFLARSQNTDGKSVCTERLAGLPKYYHRVRRSTKLIIVIPPERDSPDDVGQAISTRS